MLPCPADDDEYEKLLVLTVKLAAPTRTEVGWVHEACRRG
jgi:hypothetical protein